MQLQLKYDTVTLADAWTHKMTKVFDAKLYTEDGRVVPNTIHAAYENVLALAVVSVKGKDGVSNPYSVQWSDSLVEDDYKKLRKSVDEIPGRSGEGEKNS